MVLCRRRSSVSVVRRGGGGCARMRAVCRDWVSARRFVIDGNKIIHQRVEPEQKVEEVTFEPHEVYAIDICFTTGDGKVSRCVFQSTAAPAPVALARRCFPPLAGRACAFAC